MADIFEETLSEITGGSTAAAPELQQEQAQAAPAENNAFEQGLASQLQEPAPEKSQDVPEPGGGMER